MSLSNPGPINPGLLDAPTTGDLQTSQWMTQMTTALRQGLGQAGATDDKFVTWRDLQTEGIVTSASSVPGGGYQPVTPPEEPPDLSPPPALLNLRTSASLTILYVEWDDPDLDYYYHIEIHRSASNDLGTAVLQGTTIANIFSDPVGSDTTLYYFWARVIKESGGEKIIGPWNDTQGTPAQAPEDPEWLLDQLEGRIDETHLNDMLSGEIDKIPGLEKGVSDIEDDIHQIDLDISELQTGLQTETTERQTADESLTLRIDTNVSRIGENQSAIVEESETRASEDEALSRELTTLVAEVGDNRAAIQSESETRAEYDTVLASQITTLQVEVDGNTAAIQTESTARADEDEALSIRIDTQTARVDSNAAAIQIESEARADGDEALASQITTLAADVDDNAAAIQTESQVRATEDEALASQIITLEAEVDDNRAALQTESTTRASEDEALASRIDTVQVELDGTSGAVQVNAQAIASNSNDIVEIRTEYSVKLDVDGYVGGFGLVNDGDVITALWRVDVFGVGAPGTDELVFAIDTQENKVVMDGAFIQNATITDAKIGNLSVDKLIGDTASFVHANIADASITNAQIGNVIQSSNYASDNSGWLLNKAGFFECFQIYCRGKIDGSIIRGSVIEGGMLIQSDIQITTPTVADAGPGTTRFLSVVTTTEQAAAFDGTSLGEARTNLLPIATADFTAEGYEEYGDGQVTEPVYINFNRYLVYDITPPVAARFAIDFWADNHSMDFQYTLLAIHQDLEETVLYQTDRETAWGDIRFAGWYEGTFTGGSWRAYIHEYERCQDSSCTYSYAITQVEIVVDKYTYEYKSGLYKGLVAKFQCWTHSSVNSYVTHISITDALAGDL